MSLVHSERTTVIHLIIWYILQWQGRWDVARGQGQNFPEGPITSLPWLSVRRMHWGPYVVIAVSYNILCIYYVSSSESEGEDDGESMRKRGGGGLSKVLIVSERVEEQ
jgi:hypothetical protein